MKGWTTQWHVQTVQPRNKMISRSVDNANHLECKCNARATCLFPTISQHLFSRHLQATWTNIDRSYGLSYLSTSDSLFRVYHGSASIHSHLQSGEISKFMSAWFCKHLVHEIFRIFDSENQKQIKFKSSFTCLKSQLCALAEVPHGRNVARDNRIVVRNFSSGPGGFAEVCKDGRCVAKRARISPSSFNLFDSDQN